MTDREYILKNCSYRKGMNGPEAYFEAADGYGYTCVGEPGSTMRAKKGELTERLVEAVLARSSEHPVQPNQK